MQAEHFDKWIEALESGEHVQHRFAANNMLASLNDTPVTARCCLNLAAFVVVGRAADEMGTPASCYAAGIPVNDAMVLATMNDTDGASFAEIAEYLRRTRNRWVQS